MRLYPLLAALVALVSGAIATAQQAPSSDFSPAAFRAHVTFLGDDLLEGREAGTRGYDVAARYVASQFAALGLRPGNGESWYQPVQFVRVPADPAAAIEIGGTRLTHGRELLFRPGPGSQALRLHAPLVFAGYGLDMPARGFDDYAGLDVRGRIVVVLNGAPSGTPSDVAAHLNADKRRMAAARGAVGMIVVRTRAEAQRVAWPRLVEATRPTTSWIGADGRPFSSDGLSFSATVDPATAEALFAGAQRSAAQVLDEAAREGGRPRGFALARTARVTRAQVAETRFTSANVVGLIPGSDPVLANEPMLLMAHLDGHGVREPRPADAPGADRIRNGAMDNATGVATLIEVARQFMREPTRPRRPILLAAVTAEEIGLLGAQYLANNPIGTGRIAAVVNLDMPILTYDFSDVIAFGAEHSTLGPIVRRAAARMDVALSPDPLPQENLFTRSDHYRFVQRGVPSVFLMTGFAGEGRERFTGFLRDTYHGPGDDLSLPFNWNAGARFVQLNYLIAREIADSAESPRWYSDSLFGDAFAGDRPRAQRAR
jgi:hypothetical protein